MLTAIVIAALAGIAAGAGGFALLSRDSGTDADTVAEVANVVDAVVLEDVTDANTRQVIASQPAGAILAEQVAAGTDEAATLALAEYAICVAAAQGAEKSAGLNCEEAQQDVSAVVRAMLLPEVTP